MRAKLFVSPKLLHSLALLAIVLTVPGTRAAANTYSVDSGDTLSPTAVPPAASQETLSWSRSGGAAGASSWTTVPILLAANTVAPKEEEENKKKKEEAAPAGNPDDPGGDKKWWKEKEFFGILSGIVALLGTALPLMARGFESLSLVSRRKRELQRIEDLTGLMEKIKKENVLSRSTQDNVCAQIEAEIKTAVDQLVRNRAHREKALAARQKAQERKEREESELPLWRRILLLYRPQGIGSWIAHGFAFVYAAAAITGAVEGDYELWLGSLVILLVSWVFAWFARKRWEKAQVVEKSRQP